MARVNGESLTNGIHHVGLSVPDIQATAAFFVEVLSFKKVGEKPGYPAIFVSDGAVVLTLWQLESGVRHTSFNRKQNVGLHHLALSVTSVEVLDEVYEQLVTNNIEIEFPPEPNGSGNAIHLMCYLPGGIRVEFTAPLKK